MSIEITEPYPSFGFTNKQEWPDEALEARLDLLMDLDEGIKHGRARTRQLCHEIAHLCFELEYRYAESKLDA